MNGWTRCGGRAAEAAWIRERKCPFRTRKHGPGDRNRRINKPRLRKLVWVERREAPAFSKRERGN